ncbi:Peptidylprolyl isomerase [Histomonas meleagridis]|uniref:Peptidylprolyl isomerase n=1 Tax=Histomonas meleagridis TaxID=135588 RepID=UPI00355950A2|nr:Peptidylprolyl isomerase [Histomonas meleagridis]KAH0806696.1 Peptidylprolyl isomerase [Histomonas meleagridis]
MLNSNKIISVTPDNKITKIVHKEGYGPTPRTGEKVVLIEEGRLKDSQVIFDSSIKNGHKFKFILGKDDVIDGLTLAVSSMKLGESSTFTIDPEYGYGEKGRENIIPPNAVLEFDIELVDIREKFYNAIEADKRALAMKDEAGKLFREGKLQEAAIVYKRAFHVVNEWVNKESLEIKIVLSRNLAIVYGKLGNYGKSLKHAEYVLKTEKNDPKALLKKAEALIHFERIKEARQVMNMGLGITKNSPAFVEANKKLIELEKIDAKRENEVFAKMFKKE